MNGLSRRAVDAALDGVTYNPAVKRHDGGAAMFGHNFAGLRRGSCHAGNGRARQGRAQALRRAFGDDRAALWRARTGAGGDLGPGDGLWRRHRLVSNLQRACNARLGLPAPATVPRRAYRRACARRPRHRDEPARLARRLGGRGRPDAAHAFGLSHVSRRRPTDRGRRTSSTIPPTRSPRPRLSSKATAGSRARAGTKASPTSPPSCNGTRRRFTQRPSRCSRTSSRANRSARPRPSTRGR